MNKRQEDNRRIVMYLFDMVEKHPDLRFGQIMAGLRVVEFEGDGWKGEFYLEPSELLNRVEIAAQKLIEENL